MKITFLSLNSYPILAGKNLGYVGGAEVEQVQLGIALAAKGYEVSFITYKNGVNETEVVNGIEIMKTYNREKYNRKNVFSKGLSIWSALRKSNADIYFHEAGSSGVLPFFCQMYNRKFAFRIPSDATVLGIPLWGNYAFSNKIVDLIEIKKADVIIAQSDFQKEMLKERFEVESIVIKNGLASPKQVANPKPHPPIVLWAGTITSVKQPQLFLKLAKSIPNANFEMIGGKSDETLYNKILHDAKKLPNLRYHGFVPFHEIDEYFKRASIFVNTSSIEGFPNTFIQAWAHCSPVVSLHIDPDNLIRDKKLGFHSTTFKQLVTDVTVLLQNEKLRNTIGENARKYFEREHSIEKNVEKYIKIFEKLVL